MELLSISFIQGVLQKNYWDTKGPMYQENLGFFALIYQKIPKIFTFKYIKYGAGGEVTREIK